jgi:hypothetical protein
VIALRLMAMMGYSIQRESSMCLELSDDLIDELAMGPYPGHKRRGIWMNAANAGNVFGDVANGPLCCGKSLARTEAVGSRELG